MRTIFVLFLAVCFVNSVKCQNINNKSYNLIIGTYANMDSIHVYDFDSRTGKLKLKSKIGGVENPSYLTVSHDGKFLYANNENKNGGISSFSINPETGALVFMNRVSSGGQGPAYVSVDDKNKYVFAANYGSGGLSAISIKGDGSLSTDIQSIQQEGSSIDKKRQSGPHVHSVVLSPDNRYLLTPNLGTDKVGIYHVDVSRTSQPLTPADPEFIPVKAGSGPRHITFHPNSKYVYLIHEMGSMITSFDFLKGKLIEKQTITMLSPDFKGRVGAADIHVSSDGKFLYGSNRGEANELVIYSIDKDGKLNYAGRQSTLGNTPRNFVIDPTDKYLLVGNQDSNEVIVFKRDQKTGLLSATGEKIRVNKPSCLKFVVKN
jgi:6-phosphogluconolactonase